MRPEREAGNSRRYGWHCSVCGAIGERLTTGTTAKAAAITHKGGTTDERRRHQDRERRGRVSLGVLPFANYFDDEKNTDDFLNEEPKHSTTR